MKHLRYLPPLFLAAKVAFAQADAGADPLNLPPMPSDAECKALPVVRGPFSFGPGEVLEYDLDAMGAKAGRMTMSVKSPKDQKLPVEVAVETNTFFSKVR